MFSGLTSNQISDRILHREDNIYKKEIIHGVVKLLYKEIKVALMNGERVQIQGVGTIIPELKTHIGAYNMPTCNQGEGNPPPYVKVKLSRNNSLSQEMSKKLLDNIENGDIGFGKLSFSPQQLTILKNSGFIDDEIKDMDK